MGCTTGKPQNLNRRKSTSACCEGNDKKNKTIDSPELAYQFMMMMKQQQEFEEENPELVYAKQLCDIQMERCPHLTQPAQSSIIRNRLQKLSKLQTACTIQFQDQ